MGPKSKGYSPCVWLFYLLDLTYPKLSIKILNLNKKTAIKSNIKDFNGF